MTLGVRLLGRGGNEELHVVRSLFVDEPVLVLMTPAQAHGLFKAATLTSANTSIIVQPRPGLSVIVTDIIVSGEKQAASDITVQFTDGSDTEIMVVIDQVDSSPNMPINLNSYFHGWKDARVEMITSGAGDATVTIGYIHSKSEKTYSEWNAER